MSESPKVEVGELHEDRFNDLPPALRLTDGYLHRFRGYRYQISGTYTGVSDRGSSASDLEMCEKIEKHITPGYEGFLTLGHIAHASVNNGSAWKELMSIPDKVNDFVKASWNYGNISSDNFDLQSIMDCLNEGMPTGDFHECGLLNGTSDKSFAIVGFNENYVWVNVQGSIKHIALPKVERGDEAEKPYSLYAIWVAAMMIILAESNFRYTNHFKLDSDAVYLHMYAMAKRATLSVEATKQMDFF